MASLSWENPERPALPTGTWSAQGHSQWIVKLDTTSSYPYRVGP